MTQFDEIPWIKRVPSVAGAISIVFGTYWTGAWLLGIAPLWAPTRLIPKTNISIGLLLGGVALIILTAGRFAKPLRIIGAIAAGLIASVGLLTLVEYTFGCDLHIDQLLATEPPGAILTEHPNRMGPLGALSLVLLGRGLLAYALGRRALASNLGMVVCLLQLAPVVGRTYGIEVFYGKPLLTTIAWPAIGGLFSLGLGLFAAHPSGGLLGLLLRADPGGSLLRRRLPVLILAPVILGYIAVFGENHGLYKSAVATGILVMLLVVIFSGLLIMSAVHLSQLAKTQSDADHALLETQRRLVAALEIAQLGVWEYSPADAVIRIDPRWCEIFGLPAQKTISDETLLSMFHPDDKPMVMRQMERALSSNGAELFVAEHRILRPDGVERWVAVRGSVVDDGKLTGHTPRVAGTVMDITDARKSADAIRAERAKLEAVFQTLNVGVVVSDASGKILSMNPRALKLHEIRSLAEMPNNAEDFARRFELSQPDGALLPGRQRPLYRALRGEILADLELRVHDRVTGRRWIGCWNASSVRDSRGNLQLLVFSVQDITSRKQAEEELRRQKEELQQLLDVVPVSVWIAHDPQCRIITGNKRAYEMFGVAAGDNVSASTAPGDRTFFTPDGRQLAACELPMQVAVAKDVEIREFQLHMRSSLGGLVMLGNAVPLHDRDGAVRGCIGAFLDISEHHRGEEKLRASENRYRLLFDRSPDGVCSIDPTGRFILVNRACELISGYSQAEFAQKTFMDICAPDQLPTAVEQFERTLESGSYTELETAIIHKDGRRVELWVAGEAINEDGKIVAIHCTAKDITLRKQMERVLRDSEERYHRLFEVESDAILLVDCETGRIIDANAAAVKLYGYDRQTFLGLKHCDISAEPQKTIEAIAAKEQVIPIRWHRKQDGAVFPVEISGSYFEYQGRKVHVAAIRDIAEKFKIEEALRQSERFAHATIDALSAHICVLDETGRILRVNNAWREFAKANSASPQNLLEGSDYLAVCDPVVGPDAPTASAAATAIRSVLTGNRRVFRFEYACHSPTEKRWFVGRVSRFPGPGPARLVIAHENITHRKLAEDALRASGGQLRELAARLQAVREEERTRIAREIHDVLAQELTRLKLGIAWLARRMARLPAEFQNDDFQKTALEMREAIDTSIKAVQKIATELRPVVLDSFGLCAAIEWQAKEFSGRSGIECKVDVPDGKLTLDRDRSTALFRILQESLTNVARHSGATIVEISLTTALGQITLSVRDNGKGIGVEALKDPRAIGLLGMRERASLLGGSCEISSETGKGTLVRVAMLV